MWLVIIGILSLGLATLALIGLLTVVKELFSDCSRDADSTHADLSGGHDVGGRASGRCVMTR